MNVVAHYASYSSKMGMYRDSARDRNHIDCEEVTLCGCSHNAPSSGNPSRTGLRKMSGSERDVDCVHCLKKVNKEQVCYLHIPANKTLPAFKKPVAPYLGKMIAAWELLRPPQALALDRKGAEKVAYLFLLRDQRMGKVYINNVLFPLLAAKANVPPLDHRGRVTSHRARATIATFLGNCENPMNLW